MAISDARAGVLRLRHVRCPRCNSVLEEPTGVPVYQCGGCGASLRAKFSSGEVDTREAPLPSGSAPPSSESGRLRPRIQSRRFEGGAGDVPGTTSASGPVDAPISTGHRGADTTTTTSPSSPLSARKHASGEQSPPVSAPSSESARLHPRIQSRRFEGGAGDLPGTTSASGPVDAPISTRHRGADTTTTTSPSSPLSARKHASGEQSPPVVEKKDRRDRQTIATNQEEAGVSSEPRSRRGSRDGAELRDSEKRREPEPEADADAERKNRSGEAAARPRRSDLDEAAAKDAARTTTEIAGDAVKMSPLHEKILKTVDELRGDLSELFSKSPEVEPRTPARRSPPLLPGQDSHAARPPASPVHTTSRARHADTAAAGHRRGSKAGYVGGKVHGQAAAPRGLPSRRYRRCRADPCERPGPCRYGCCKHGAPECRSHCCGSRAKEPAPRREKPPAAAREAKRRAPPRQHCRPVLKGAPFIVCSSCFALVQVPAGFAVPNKKVSKLRCGSCSAVLSYSYRDPAGKKKVPDDQYSTDGSSRGGARTPARPDPFSFIEDFAHGQSCSYSTTEDEQPLHVSRNSSLSTIVGASGALHRLMGYGSATELLLLPRSPSLYERSHRRPTVSPSPPDRKGKGVWVDDGAAAAAFDDDSDDDDSRGALRRSHVAGRKARGGRGGVPAPAAGPIRIRS